MGNPLALPRAILSTNPLRHNDTRSPFQTSGLRIGAPADKTRGMKESEMIQIAGLMETIIQNITDESIITATKKRVMEFCAGFPLMY